MSERYCDQCQCHYNLFTQLAHCPHSDQPAQALEPTPDPQPMTRAEADAAMAGMAERAGEPPTTALAWGERPPDPQPASLCSHSRCCMCHKTHSGNMCCYHDGLDPDQKQALQADNARLAARVEELEGELAEARKTAVDAHGHYHGPRICELCDTIERWRAETPSPQGGGS